MTDGLTYLAIGNDAFFSEVKKLLAEGKVVRLKARGRSMEPLIREGRDEIVLSAYIEPKKGRIVLARTEEGIVLHRIIGIDGNAVTLMGDGNLYQTESCSMEDVIAGVTSIVRNDKSIDPECFMEIFKARIWMIARPVRRPLLKIWKTFCK